MDSLKLLPALALAYLMASLATEAAGQTVTVIESQSSEPSSLLVSTSDHSYVILRPSLHNRTAGDWIAVAVNGEQLFIIRHDNTTRTGALSKLDAYERDLLAATRSVFLENLAGLSLSRAYSSRAGSRPKLAKTGLVKCPVGYGEYSSTRRSSYSRWSSLGPNLNLHNLYGSELSVRLEGDIYHFDLSGNVLDVFSASVSLRQGPTESVLYRDQNFFSYSRPCMPLTINRFFVHGTYVIFVYNDATVLVKTSSMLDDVELDLVIQAIKHIEELSNPSELLPQKALYLRSDEPDLDVSD